MPIASDELKLFGLDLRNLWGEVRGPWRKLARASGLSWLAPETAVFQKSADGTVFEWKPAPSIHGFQRGSAAVDAGASGQSLFEAVLLPDDLLLRKRLSMPRIDGEQVKQALALEALNSTPFPAGDLVWGYALRSAASNAPGAPMDVELVLASRRRVEQFLNARDGGGASSAQPEVWVRVTDHDDQALLINGFGEEKREQATQRYWRVLAGLGVIVVALCVAMAATPYVQLHSKAVQANQAYAALDKAAAPAIAKREALLKAEEQAKALADIIGHRVDPLQVVQMLTTTLPDDTMLQRLQITDRKVFVAGQAADAASLMQKLGALSEVREVKAPSAAVRQPGMLKESFQIEFHLTDDFGVSEDSKKTDSDAKDDSATQTKEAKAAASTASSAADAASQPASAASAPASSPAASKDVARPAEPVASEAKSAVAAASAPVAQKPLKTDKKPTGGAQ